MCVYKYIYIHRGIHTYIYIYIYVFIWQTIYTLDHYVYIYNGQVGRELANGPGDQGRVIPKTQKYGT